MSKSDEQSDEQLLKQARDRFKIGYEADQAQRQQDIEALKMFALDQWPETIAQSRQAQAAITTATGTVPATGARPCLVVDKLREPVNQIVNQERESDLAVELVAADDFGGLTQPIDPAEIELREGLIRRIQRESESASARTWAFERAAITGRGYYAINTRYVPGRTFDQEVYCRRLFNQSCVVLDPAHEEPDGSDAQWGFIFTVLSHAAYLAEYPDAEKGLDSRLETDWLALEGENGEAPGWFTEQGEQKYVRVAEHWYTEFESKELYLMPSGWSAIGADGKSLSGEVWREQVPAGAPEPVAKRTVVKPKVRWCKMDGCQILEKREWLSPFIPIVKIVGNEIPPYDAERRVDGLLNKSARSSQMGTNFMASKLAEEIGLSAVSPLLVEEGTIEGYEDWWNQANTRAFPWLPFKSTNLLGQQSRVPQRPDKSLAIQPIAQGMQMFMEAIQTSTGVPDPQMGKPSRFSETWRGTQALITQSERGTSNYMDNLARSVCYEGRIMNSLLYPIYGTRPGRIARIVKGESEAETVVIGQPFMMQDNGQGQQRPVPAPPGATAQQEGVREYKLTPDANFNVAVKVTKGYDTRRQEEGAMLGEMVTQQPQMMSIFGDLFFAAQDWPGSKEAKERMKTMLAPPVLAYLQSKEGGQAPIPPQALQQMQQMQQQLQEVTQAAQGMQQELQTRQQETAAKIAGEREIALIKAESEQALAQIKAMEAIRIAEIKAGTDLQSGREKSEADQQLSLREHVQEMDAQILAAQLQPEPQPEAQV